MDPLEFAHVSVAEARLALDGASVKPGESGAPAANRTNASAEPLLGVTQAWIATLPPDVRPVLLAAQFPRIANRLRFLWKQVARCEAYLDDLLVDRRGTRKGFPLAITEELSALREHYAVLHPGKASRWDYVETGR